MKTMKNLMLVGSVVCATAVGSLAQQTTTAPTDTRNDTQIQSGASYLMKANKASGLIGMDVRNQQNEKLGDIKDLAVDLHTGKIAYAVLSVGGFLGIGDKYIAVPPNEFTMSPDGKDLILNADKAKIQGAPGFAKSNWPDLNSWQTHSTYWLPETSALGTAGAVRSGRDTGGTLKSDVLNEGTVSGRVTSVDAGANALTLEDASGKHQFTFNDHSALTLKNTPSARLENVKVGDEVTIRYHDQNGSKVADTITDSTHPASR